MSIAKYFKLKFNKVKNKVKELRYVADDDWQQFKKLNNDSNYYRIPLEPLASARDYRNKSREALHILAHFCQRDLEIMWGHNLITFYGQIDPDLDTIEFMLDKGNYFFVRVPSIEKGEFIFKDLYSYYKCNTYNSRVLRYNLLQRQAQKNKNPKTSNYNELHSCLSDILFR